MMIYSSNSELLTIPKTLNNVLSNFNFTRGVVAETSDEWTIRLDGTDVCTAIIIQEYYQPDTNHRK